MSEILNVETIMSYFESQELYKSAKIVRKKITDKEAYIFAFIRSVELFK